jgi:hypothetical protein
MASSNITIVSDDSDHQAPPRNSPDLVLSRINLSFYESKAVQIFRLVKDQEELNKRFQDSTIHCHSDNGDSDNSLSDNSIKETERRLAQRLSVHKQKGGRSKTSIGFYNDKNSVNNSSSDEDEFKMADDDRMINTRINRPKSSYVRRRHLPTDTVDDDSHVDTSVQRRCRSTRPPSRIGIRDVEASNRECPSHCEVEPRKMVLKETSYNFQAPPAPQANNDFIDPIGYERYAHTKTPVPSVEMGIRRERTDLRNLNTNSWSENVDNSFSKAQYEKHIKSRHKEDTMSELSPKRRHRRQQFNNVRASRPSSENVYLVRQRTEARMLKNGNSTTNLNNRPKSDRLIMTSNGPKPILSIDHNPVNSSNSGYQKNNVQSPNSKLDYPSSRPISRRGRQGQERPGVITKRPPLSLMKLPPLDSNVSKRAERIALTTTCETCV